MIAAVIRLYRIYNTLFSPGWFLKHRSISRFGRTVAQTRSFRQCVDIGGGTTDLAIYEHGSVWHTAVLPIGGEHFTNDIAVGLRTPIPEAEKIKKRFGCAMAGLVNDDDVVEVPSVGGRKPRLVQRQILAAIIEPRAQELMSMVKEEISSAGYDKSLNSGLVLTGGGTLLDVAPDLGCSCLLERQSESACRPPAKPSQPLVEQALGK